MKGSIDGVSSQCHCPPLSTPCRSRNSNNTAQVTCLPDIEVHDRTPQDEFLILGCDGVWDVFSSEEGVGLMREILLTGETSMLKCAEELIDMALSKGKSHPPLRSVCVCGWRMSLMLGAQGLETTLASPWRNFQVRISALWRTGA